MNHGIILALLVAFHFLPFGKNTPGFNEGGGLALEQARQWQEALSSGA